MAEKWILTPSEKVGGEGISEKRENKSPKCHKNEPFPIFGHVAHISVVGPKSFFSAIFPLFQEEKNSLNINFWAGDSWDITDPDVGISRTISFLKVIFRSLVCKQWFPNRGSRFVTKQRLN